MFPCRAAKQRPCHPRRNLPGRPLCQDPAVLAGHGLGDFTKINIANGDFGGELDPHGATGDGNPVGGNVTANATGQDVHYEEWMK